MEKYHDQVTDARGNALVASVTVTDSEGGAVSVYEDDESTVLAQPITTNSQGEFSFKAPNGEYIVTVTRAGASDSRDVRLFDIDDHDAPLPALTVNTSRVLARSDVGKLLVRTLGDATLTTIDSDDDSIPNGALIEVLSRTTGGTTIAAGSGVTLRYYSGSAVVTGSLAVAPGGKAWIHKENTLAWNVWGFGISAA